MNIGIDARMLGPTVGGGGLGRYVEELTRGLSQLDHKHRYVLFLKSETQLPTTGGNTFDHRIADVHWYTLLEQVIMPHKIDQEDLDLIHYPHWNIPVRAKTPFVVTIHDLILLEQPRSARATTRGPLMYWVKHALFRRVLRHAVKKSRAIIAPSQYTKNSILHFFPDTAPGKIHVVHEGITDLVRLNAPPNTDTTPYLLYVGNAYPHKNLERLLEAFKIVRGTHPEINLVLAGKDGVFYQRLKATAPDGVTFRPDPTDSELASLYQGAKGYVFPSLSEGFGLPPLEAMSFSVPVAAARSSCLPEILGDAVTYFNPQDTQDMSQAISRLLSDERLRETLIAKGKEQIKKYSWQTMAEEIQTIYNNCAG
ncbi:MAG: glycosyltransferase family 4 protein [Parcubacteria group bacterium]|nr:glycosyltransferase family 4 protein [Parcubacteria group bacterium]